MGIAAAAANYLILLPMFEVFNVLPFNVLKGLVIGIFTMVVYKRLTSVLKGVR